MVRRTTQKCLLLLTLLQAGVIVTIQVPLLTSNSMATSIAARAILSFGIIFELLGAMFAISFLQHPQNDVRRGMRFVKRLPYILVSFGIVGLAAVLLMEAFKMPT